MNRTRRLGAVLGAAAVGLAAAGGLVAQAATSPGWRIVASHHYPPQADDNGLLSVVAPAKADAWAFGGNNLGSAPGTNIPVAEKWNGSTWQTATLPAGVTGNLAAASAPAANDIWAVSTQTGYLLYFNGSAWSVAKTFAAGLAATGVTAFSPTNVWVFGTTGFGPGLGTWHLHGTTWTQVTGLGGSITTASALSASDIWAISSVVNPQDAIVRNQGSGWKQVTSTALTGGQFNNILALSPTNVWVSGVRAGTSTPLLAHLDGTTWATVAVPFKLNLGAMTSDGQGGLWMTAGALPPANQAWVVHLAVSSTGALTWTRHQLTSGAGGNAFDITLIPGTTSLWAAGSTPATTTTGSSAAIWADGPIG